MMTVHDALKVLAAHRGNRIVVTTMASVGVWPGLSDTGLDFNYLPSSMGQGVALGLGLALSQARGVVVVTGDGSLLMNLGSLVTVANHPAPLAIIVIDNGLYEVTGGQQIVGSRRTDFGKIARGAGLEQVYQFNDVTTWESCAAEALSHPGPALICLRVKPKYGQKTPSAPRPMAEQIRRLQEAIA